MLPKGIALLTTFFPGTYSAGLFRNYFMSSQVNQLENLLNTKYASVSKDVVENIKSNFSFDLDFFGTNVTPNAMALAIVVFIIIFLVLNLIFSSSKYLNMGKVKKIKSDLTNKKDNNNSNQ